jgi:hypothetical protein
MHTFLTFELELEASTTEDKKLIMNLSEGLAKTVSFSMELEARLNEATKELDAYRAETQSASRKRKPTDDEPEPGGGQATLSQP